MNISTTTITICGLGLLLLVILALIFIRRRRKAKASSENVDFALRMSESVPNNVEQDSIGIDEYVSDIQHTDASPPSKILAAVGARQLLEQVNRHVLEGTGELAQGKGAIRLVWSDPESGTARSIMIRIQDSQTLLINGRPFPATREGIQQGLVTLLKGMGLSGNRDRVSEDS